MNIELCTLEDIHEIRKLWKQGGKDLGVPFTNELQNLINSKHFFVQKTTAMK